MVRDQQHEQNRNAGAELSLQHESGLLYGHSEEAFLRWRDEVLRRLTLGGESSVEQIAADIGMNQNVVGDCISSLCSDGLVERTTQPFTGEIMRFRATGRTAIRRGERPSGESRWRWES
jgi:hypothetical protein